MSQPATQYIRVSNATQDAIEEAEARWRERRPPFRLIDAIDEFRATEAPSSATEALFDQTVSLDLNDWLELPLASIDRTRITARYGLLWRIKQRDRARRFLRVLGALRRFAAQRHPHLDLGPDPFTFHTRSERRP